MTPPETELQVSGFWLPVLLNWQTALGAKHRTYAQFLPFRRRAVEPLLWEGE